MASGGNFRSFFFFLKELHEQLIMHEKTLFFIPPSLKFLAWECLIILAIDLISHHLLQVNVGYRLAAANALKHAFFEVCAWFSFYLFIHSWIKKYTNNILIQDYQLYCDLRKLEDSCARERWLTIPEDDDKWEQYAKENGFIVKSSDGKISWF